MSDHLFRDLKVLDIGNFVAAPAAATIFSDFGAQVIKIEPLTGDPYRSLSQQEGYPKSTRNYCWEVDARNKQSLALDLTKEASKTIVKRLIQSADILITNIPLGAREKLGIHYDLVKSLNHRMIYASLTAYGEQGAEAGRPGFDSTAWWARSGLMDQVRNGSDGVPSRSSPAMGDHQSALALYSAIVTALYKRSMTGQGGYVSSSLLANGAWSNACLIQAALFGAEFPVRATREVVKMPLSNHYACQDGQWLMLSMSVSPAVEEKTWPLFCQLIHKPSWIEDVRFKNRQARLQHAALLIQELDSAFLRHTAATWKQLLGQAGIVCALVARSQDVLNDQQMWDAGVLVAIDNDQDKRCTVNSPFEVEGCHKVKPSLAPAIGQHSRDILLALGYSEAQVLTLSKQGVTTLV